MAIDFPASPSVGQQYVFNGVTYTFSSQQVWVSGVTANLPATGVWGIRGLTGVNTPSFTTTKLNFSYSYAMLMDASGNMTRDNTSSTFTVDTGLAGPAANGRDQAGAFSASQFLHFYVIGGPGQTTAGLVSTVGPDTFVGATLPANYTRWAYVCSVYWNGSSNLVSIHVRGGWVYYDTRSTALSAGTATTETAVSLTSIVPTVARSITLFYLVSVDSTVGAVNVANIRPVSGLNYAQMTTTDTGTPGFTSFAAGSLLIPNISQNFYYLLTDTVGTADLTRQMDIYVLGYSIPNGDN